VESGGAASHERNLERFLTFVDAVVAIAITLLVLPLVEFSGELRGSDLSVLGLLRDHSAELWAFFLSFAVIAKFWFIQHRSASHVVAYDSRYATLTVLWLLTIVFLPFSTSLVPVAPDDPLTKVLYIGTMALGVAFLGAAELVTLHHPELTDGLGRPDPLLAWINVALLLVALVVSLLIPAIGYAALLVLVLDSSVASVWRRWRPSATVARGHVDRR
jgi:uncharacterized membrane protein